MSTTYFTWAFPAAPEEVSVDVGALEDAGSLLAQVAECHLLMSASRNNWLLNNLRILSSTFGLWHLHRLGNVSSVVPTTEVPSVIREIESLLEYAREAPQLVGSLLNSPCEAAEVSAGLEASAEAVTPHLGPTGADEGDAPQYLFSWLKSLHALLGYAHRSGLCVVHVQPRAQA